MIYAAGSDRTNYPGLSGGFEVKAPFGRPKPPSPPRTPQSSIRSARAASSPYTPARRGPIPAAFQNVPGRTIYNTAPSAPAVESVSEKSWITWSYCLDKFQRAEAEGVFAPTPETTGKSISAIKALVQDFKDLRANLEKKLGEAAVAAVKAGYFVTDKHRGETIVDADVENFKKGLRDAEKMIATLEKSLRATEDCQMQHEQRNWFSLYVKHDDE